MTHTLFIADLLPFQLRLTRMKEKHSLMPTATEPLFAPVTIATAPDRSKPMMWSS
jgi:hypothetical protein